MVCVYCKGQTRVTNSRQQRRTNTTWRRRECQACGGVFTTQELIKLDGAVLVAGSLTGSAGFKNPQTRFEPFSRDRLWLSLRNSLGHRKQPTADATGLTETVIGRLLPHVEQAKLTRQQIIAVTTEVLTRFDKAAATHYQAYHPL